MTERPDAPDKNVDPAGLSPGLQLLHALHMLISSAKIYTDNSKLLIAAVQGFVEVVAGLFSEDDEIVLLASSGRFYLQQERVSYRSNLAALVNDMLVFFEKRKLGGLRFHPAAAEMPPATIATFARLLQQCCYEDDPEAWLESQLRTDEFAWVEPVPLSDSEDDEALEAAEKTTAEEQHAEQVETEDHERNKKEKTLLAYGYALNSLQEISRKVSSDKRASMKKAVRMVHIMIDTVMDDSDMLLSLSSIRDYDDYTFTHSLNVAILSMCLGHRIGLNKRQLETLSLSALFHDLGKVDVPKDILNKPGKLDDEEFREMRNHSIYSVRHIILLKASHRKKAEIMLPPFEHHLKFDLSGYPQTPRKKPLSLFGRIIAIADVFDALTARRVYRTFPISPDRALGIMQEGSGTDFDPVLLKVFVNMIGVYPVGTLLRFTNGELGLVAKYGGENSENRELWVQMLLPGKKGFARGELINLGPLDQQNLTFNRPIRESMHPSVYSIQPADFIL